MPGLHQHCGLRMFSAARPWCVGTKNLEAENILHRGLETDERARARIRLVAAHDGGPLLGTHRAGARVGQQVNEDVFGLEREDVVARRFHGRFSFCGRDEADGFGHFDAKGFGGVGGHRVSNVCRFSTAMI